MTFLKPASVVAIFILAAGCESGVAPAPEFQFSAEDAPDWAPPGTCWGKDVMPAVVETVTEQIEAEPATYDEAGLLVSPAVYRTETRQAIVRERVETWFETPCPEMQTPEFISTLQRALQARGLYRGAITGQMDRRTHEAVRAYQAEDGLDSGLLSLASARQLGIVALDRAATLE